eukprot:CAMPEP_0181498544 /NCGR_PEP_ID=MMETSP1110-20121109/54160_1 /TAXON_ID=174948 /ORGANISM="Symbiodinium sp., Strain CCMP421" /LENGTH=109 /DNA_ID=CAMNT_0023626627 /DNA_START=84 /DNA_END=409 /DNA_ORIENTATION=-
MAESSDPIQGQRQICGSLPARSSHQRTCTCSWAQRSGALGLPDRRLHQQGLVAAAEPRVCQEGGQLRVPSLDGLLQSLAGGALKARRAVQRAEDLLRVLFWRPARQEDV